MKLVTQVQTFEDALAPREPSEAQIARVKSHEKAYDATRREHKTHKSAKKALRAKKILFE